MPNVRLPQSSATLPKASMQYVYFFGDGKAEGHKGMKEILGGKGAGLAEMTNAGLPVPPGFTIPTEACREYMRNGTPRQRSTARCTPRSPAGRSCRDRSSAPAKAAAGQRALRRQVLHAGHDGHHPQPRPQRPERRRPRQAEPQPALRLRLLPPPDPDVRQRGARHPQGRIRARLRRARRSSRSASSTPTSTPTALQGSHRRVQEDRAASTRHDFPQDPHEQLAMARDAVFRSLEQRPRASTTAASTTSPTTLGTAVNVQSHGLRQHGRDQRHRRGLHPQSRHRREGVLRRVPDERAGRRRRRRHPHARAHQRAARRSCRRSTNSCARSPTRLEKHYRDMQDIEFTIEDGKLYMLQTRNGKRTGRAAVRIAVEMVKSLITQGRGHHPRRAQPARRLPASRTSTKRASKIEVLATGLARLSRRRRRADRLHRRRRGRASPAQAQEAGDPGPRRDHARGH